MMLTAILLAAAPLTTGTDLVAIRAPRVEVGNGETLHHAVILVEDGRIVTIGEDLPIERGIPTLELADDQVVLPGLVSPHTRLGMPGGGYNDARPWIRASFELDPTQEDYETAREAGFTTLGQYPAGNAIPGQAVAVRPKGATPEAMVVRDPAYLMIAMASNRSAKSNLSDGFDKADKWLEKEAKNREKWEKDKEKFDKEKDEEKKAKLDPGPYVPIESDEKAQAFLDLRAGTLKALISIRQASDYLHLLDAKDDEEFTWDLLVELTRQTDVFYVKDKIGETGMRVVMEPFLTLHPGTMRQRNLPAEFVAAGAKLALLPRGSEVEAHEDYLRDVGEVVAAGLDPQVAIRAMTLEAAAVLGLDAELGSLEAGKAANLIILSGDPFEVGTEVDAVMLDGEFVHGEVNL